MARRRWSDKDRASAVLMLEAAGYPDTKGALAHVSSHLGVPVSTLRGWYLGEHNPVPAEVRTETKANLAESLLDLVFKMVAQADRTVDEATFRELMVGLGIGIDKLQLLTGAPTERQEINVNDHRDRLLATVARKADIYVARESSGVHQGPVA